MRPWKPPATAGPFSLAALATSAPLSRTGSTALALTRSASARYWPSDQHNIGIACGPSRLVVVDLDTHGHLPEDWRLLPGIRDGRDVLAQLAEWAGKPWPSTYMVATANGGWHLYFTAPEGGGIRNSASLLGPLVDVRGPAATSWRPGREWTASRMNCSMPAIRYRCLHGSASSSPPRLRSHRRRDAGAFRLARGCKDSSNTVRSGKAGDRNNPLYWASRRAAEMIAAGEITRDDAEEPLVAAALEAGLRGGEPEARRTFASAMRGAGL